MTKKLFPAIVIPTYNEKNNIINLIKDIRKYVSKALIIIVDDNSPDNTAAVIQKLTRTDKKTKLIKRQKKLGRGSAVITGFKHTLQNKNITHFIEMDADFSHDPNELKNLIQTCQKSDMVIASRYLKQSKIINWPIERKAFSFLANTYAKIVLQIPISDYTNGYRCYSRKTLELININQLKETGYALLMEMAYVIHRHNLSIAQIPTTFVNRRRGQSNTTFKEILNALNAPLRIRLKHA